MSSRRARRPDLTLRGPGHLPKGGVRVAVEHNARVRSAPVSASPETPDARTDARASASSGRATAARLLALGVGLGTFVVSPAMYLLGWWS